MLQVAEGVILPDDVDPYMHDQAHFPTSLLVPFMDKWQLHHQAAPHHQQFVAAAAAAAGINIVPIPGAASAYRSVPQQIQLFTQRYLPGNGPNQKTWNGVVYFLKPGFAGAAVPGTSNHGFGLAVDYELVGGAAITLAVRQKLRAIGAPFSVVDTVLSENWHFACQHAQDISIPAPAVPPAPTVEPPTVHFRVLAVGSVGMDVAWVQNVLRDKCSQPVGPSDGMFGPKTEAGVRNVQAFTHLPVTGVVDAATHDVLLWIDNSHP